MYTNNHTTVKNLQLEPKFVEENEKITNTIHLYVHTWIENPFKGTQAVTFAVRVRKLMMTIYGSLKALFGTNDFRNMTAASEIHNSKRTIVYNKIRVLKAAFIWGTGVEGESSSANGKEAPSLTGERAKGWRPELDAQSRRFARYPIAGKLCN